MTGGRKSRYFYFKLTLPEECVKFINEDEAVLILDADQAKELMMQCVLSSAVQEWVEKIRKSGEEM